MMSNSLASAASRTSHDWVMHINGLSDPSEIISVAVALSSADLVKEDDQNADIDRFDLPKAHIIEHALEKYFVVGGAVQDLFVDMRGIVSGGQNDLLELKVITYDVIVRRGKLEEIKYLHSFLKFNRSFMPNYIFSEVSRMTMELGQIDRMKESTKGLVSGTIEIKPESAEMN